MSTAIVKTDAVVLKAMKYRETSKIVTFYTRQFGKLAGLVKGARSPKSKISGVALEPMSYDSVVLYKKEGRDLQTITQCDVVKSFRSLTEDLDKMAVGLAMVELVDIVAHAEEENVPLFTLLVNMLDALDETQNHPTNLLFYFEIGLAGILGFRLSFDRCISCRKPVEYRVDGEKPTAQFHLGRGGLLCSDCSNVAGHKISLSEQAIRILRQLVAGETAADIVDVSIDRQSKAEIESFLWMYLRFHVSGFRALRSNKVFSKILETA